MFNLQKKWTGGVGGEWRALLDNIIDGSAIFRVGAEPLKTHPVAFSYLKHKFFGSAVTDISKILSEAYPTNMPVSMKSPSKPKLQLWRRSGRGSAPKMFILPHLKCTNLKVLASAIAPVGAWDIRIWSILSLRTAIRPFCKPV